MTARVAVATGIGSKLELGRRDMAIAATPGAAMRIADSEMG